MIQNIIEKLKDNLQYGMSTTLTPDDAHNLILYIEEKERVVYIKELYGTCVTCDLNGKINKACVTCDDEFSNWQPKPKVEVVHVPDPGNDKYGENSIPATHA